MDQTRDTLRRQLKPFRTRVQRLGMLCAAILGFAVGSGLVLMLTMWPVAGWTLGPLGAAVSPWLVALPVALTRLLRPVPWARLARLVDQRGGLQDRVETAWDFVGRGPLEPLQRCQVHDAIRRLSDLHPGNVAPWIWPKTLWYALGVWAVAILLSSVPVGPRVPQARSQPSQRRADVGNAEIAEELEVALLDELRQLAKLTGTPPPDRLALDRTAQEIAGQLEQLQRPGQSPSETLATLSQMQAALSRTLADLDTAQINADLNQLARAIGAAERLESVQKSLADREFEQAATSLESLDLSELSEVERETVAEELRRVVEAYASRDAAPLAEGTRSLQAGLQDNSDRLVAEGTQALASRLREQAARMAIQAELENQMVLLAEAKGQGQSGGNDTTPSDRSRETWGRGRAGDPLTGSPSELATTRQREHLTGIQGQEGPSDRQTRRTDQAQGRATLPYRSASRISASSVEQVLSDEAVPLGQRQTIRRYFRAIRPD